MKNNRSLAVSTKIEELKGSNLLGLLEKEFPSLELKNFEESNTRNRVFTPVNTLMTMVFTATQEDKTLKNSVNQYYTIHQRHRNEVLQGIEEDTISKAKSEKNKKRKPGRPEKPETKIPESLKKEISLNTAAYSKARSRIPLSMTQKLFESSRIENAENNYTHFHGYQVFLADGTYLQLQDTEAIQQEFPATPNSNEFSPYPQGLLEVLTARGTGQIHTFRLANRKKSELPLFYEMLDELPEKSVAIADDLYNCYEIILKAEKKGVKLLIPAKRERHHEVVEVLGEGDEIIRIKAPDTRSKWLKNPDKPQDILLRRIKCITPQGNPYILHTTIMEKTIEKEELQKLYLSRWDIEISIREIKTIMGVNILRSKTPDMVKKELTVSLATYNLIRKIIYASVKNLPFSPKEDFIYKYYTLNKNILTDKKGRVYNRWSPGRKGAEKSS